MSNRHQHIIWDWNGTLLDDVHVCIDIMNGMLHSYDLPPMDMQRYRSLFTFPVRNYYEALGFPLENGVFEELSVVFVNGYEARRGECALRPGTREALEAVRTAGMTQSILSAYPQPKLEEVIDTFALSPYFVRLIGLDNIYAAGKEDNARRWVRELGLPPAEILLVGDTVHDYEVAKAISADCVLIENGHQCAQRLRACGVPVCPDLATALDCDV